MAHADADTIQVKAEDGGEAEAAEKPSPTINGLLKIEDSPNPMASPASNGVDTKDDKLVSTMGSAHDIELDASQIKEDEEIANGHVSPKKSHSRQSKSGRAASSKMPSRIAPLFNDVPDATEEAEKSFSVMDACTYQNKYLGFTEHAMECDCSEEWDPATKTNHACGEDSDCINRATKMECVGDCACGSDCQNQRFGRRLYADVSVIKTEKKGYGLRTNVDLKHGDFIFEYIGEVIGEAAFRRRMVQYDEEGIKHFYFMSLSKGEFVDATRKGNLGRFCNHSCNPNCYVDKWVVGDKLRMGIFAERRIRAGEELVFNYNVDRYGANPQPCYCGESNCTGFIGGKTQTERATKLSAATMEALGIDDDFDAWDTVVAKRPRKKKASEDDEDYVDSIEAKNLDADGVTKVMAALMQCKEKWIAVRLLQRIQRSDDEDVRHRIVKLHGYKIMNSQLSAWKDDENVVLQILEILNQFPRLTRNKIVDAKIDKTLEPLIDHSDERVALKASFLINEWSKLELAYRIPRKVRDGNATKTPTRIDRVGFERRASTQVRQRSKSRSRSRSPSKSPPRGPSGNVPAGPRSQQRHPLRPPVSNYRAPLTLPKGWSQATDEKTGRIYFYTASGKTQWVRPTIAADLPPPPPKQPSQQDVLKSIIDDIVSAKDKEKDNATPDTPKEVKKDKLEKWRSYDEEKQKKLYENTLYPHISYVMNKYKHKIPRDDLKRFGKELAKKLVNSDYKAGRVKNPTKIEEKQQKKVKAFCKEYFDKAAAKHQKHQEEKAARKAKKDSGIPTRVAATVTPGDSTPSRSPEQEATPVKTEANDDEDIKMSDNEIEDDETPASPSQQSNGALKRKLAETDIDDTKLEAHPLHSPSKRLNLLSEDSDATMTNTPPPPPAPPADSPPDTGTPVDEMETDIHADTNFKDKSMADVQALAQQEEDDDETQRTKVEDGTSPASRIFKDERIETKFEGGLGADSDEIKTENPLVDGQDIVQRIKEERS